MNPEAQAELDRILLLDPADLSESERDFLQARRSYLTEEQRINFDITEKAKSPAKAGLDESDVSPLPSEKSGRKSVKA